MERQRDSGLSITNLLQMKILIADKIRDLKTKNKKQN